MNTHIKTGNYPVQPVARTNDERAKEKESTVRACVDILCVAPEGKVLLRKRKEPPWPDWWYIGGGAKIGLIPEQSAAVNLLRELDIRVPPDRFAYLGHQSPVWCTRWRDPEHGYHDWSHVFRIYLDANEIANMTMNTDDFIKLMWFTPEEILTAGFHKGVKNAVRWHLGTP